MTALTTKQTAVEIESHGLEIYAGVDTHRDTHHVALVNQVGRTLRDEQFPATGVGYRRIVDFLHHYGPVTAVGVEGTGSYGAELSRVLRLEGFGVVEVMRPNRQRRRLKGKSDPLDALQAAMTVLTGRGLATPKERDAHAESLRILLAERSLVVKTRSATMNQIHALLIASDNAVREDYRRYSREKLITIIARTRPSAGIDPEQIARQSLKRLAVRHQNLGDDIVALDLQLDTLVRQLNPALLDANGIGPVVAATLLAAVGDNPERIIGKAQFAALCGVAPIPASSGQRVRHRLSRGGDRRANHAIHRIVLVRHSHHDPRTMEYFQRRRAEGLSDRDIVRCLKRHVANEVFALLAHPAPARVIGQQLRQQRKDLNITITDLAETLHVPYQRLRRLEIGKRTDTDLEARCQQRLDNVRQSRPVKTV